MNADDPSNPSEPVPSQARLGQPREFSAEEALSEYTRLIDEGGPPKDEADRFVRERQLANMRRFLSGSPDRGRRARPQFSPALLKEYAELLKASAERLLEDGTVDVRSDDDDPVRSRIRRFEDGSSVLESSFGTARKYRYLGQTTRPGALAAELALTFLSFGVRPQADSLS